MLVGFQDPVLRPPLNVIEPAVENIPAVPLRLVLDGFHLRGRDSPIGRDDSVELCLLGVQRIDRAFVDRNVTVDLLDPPEYPDHSVVLRAEPFVEDLDVDTAFLGKRLPGLPALPG